MSQFTKLGNTYFRQDNSGELFAVSDPDTLRGLQKGQLPYNAVENTRGLSFAGGNKTTDAPAPAPTSAPSAPATDAPATNAPEDFKQNLINTIMNYKGVTDTSQLEEKRQNLLRQQMLSAPYSAEGDKDLTAAHKLSLMRTRGQEFEPELQAIEQEIITKKNLPVQQLQTMSAMVGLAKDLGLLDPDRLEELKIANPEISFADTMEEALGYLGGVIRADTELSRKVKQAQLNAATVAADALKNGTGTKILPPTNVSNLSDARFLPGELAKLEKTIKDKPGLFGKLKNVEIIGTDIRLNPFAAMSTDTNIADAEFKRIAQLVGKFMEGGVLRKEDEVKYAKMLPGLQDLNPTVAQAKLDGVREMLAMKYNNYLIDFNGSGYDVAAFAPIDFGIGVEGGNTQVMTGPGGTYNVALDKVELFKANGYK